MSLKTALLLLPALALPGCQQPPQVVSYGNDALPSAEVIAFQSADARLRYRDARIEFDENNCPVYQGTAPDGKLRRELLRSPAGEPLCARR